MGHPLSGSPTSNLSLLHSNHPDNALNIHRPLLPNPRPFLCHSPSGLWALPTDRSAQIKAAGFICPPQRVLQSRITCSLLQTCGWALGEGHGTARFGLGLVCTWGPWGELEQIGSHYLLSHHEGGGYSASLYVSDADL